MTNWDYAAKIVWPILTARARERELIRYGEIAPIIKTIPLAVGRALGPIQEYCLQNQLPPLTSIVVGVDGKPGGGFIAWDVDDIDTAHRHVFAFDWREVQNPYRSFRPNDSVESLGETLAREPHSGEQILKRVKDRGVFQRIFRAALLRAYGRCAMCGLTFEEALEAAHIVPWIHCNRAECSDIKNGLLLCAVHHRLFDSKWFAISKAARIIYRDPAQKEGPYSPIDERLTTMLHKKQLLLPALRKHRPAQTYFDRRAELMKQA